MTDWVLYARMCTGARMCVRVCKGGSVGGQVGGWVGR